MSKGDAARAALRARIAEATRRLPDEVEGRSGELVPRDEAVGTLLRWAGDDTDKLRRALVRVHKLATPTGVSAHAPPPGPKRLPAPRTRQ